MSRLVSALDILRQSAGPVAGQLVSALDILRGGPDGSADLSPYQAGQAAYQQSSQPAPIGQQVEAAPAYASQFMPDITPYEAPRIMQSVPGYTPRGFGGLPYTPEELGPKMLSPYEQMVRDQENAVDRLRHYQLSTRQAMSAPLMPPEEIQQLGPDFAAGRQVSLLAEYAQRSGMQPPTAEEQQQIFADFRLRAGRPMGDWSEAMREDAAAQPTFVPMQRPDGTVDYVPDASYNPPQLRPIVPYQPQGSGTVLLPDWASAEYAQNAAAPAAQQAQQYRQAFAAENIPWQQQPTYDQQLAEMRKSGGLVQDFSSTVGRGAAGVAGNIAGFVDPETGVKLSENARKAYGESDPMSPGSILGGAAVSTAQMLPAMANPAMAAPTLFGMGLQSAGQKRQEIHQRRQAGQNIDPVDEWIATILTGGAEVALEKISLGAFMRTVDAVKPAIVLAAMQGNRQALIALGRQLAEQAAVNTGVNISEEQLTALAQDLVDRFTGVNKNPNTIENLAQATASGGAMGVTGTAAATAQGYAQQSEAQAQRDRARAEKPQNRPANYNLGQEQAWESANVPEDAQPYDARERANVPGRPTFSRGRKPFVGDPGMYQVGQVESGQVPQLQEGTTQVVENTTPVVPAEPPKDPEKRPMTLEEAIAERDQQARMAKHFATQGYPTLAARHARAVEVLDDYIKKLQQASVPPVDPVQQADDAAGQGDPGQQGEQVGEAGAVAGQGGESVPKGDSLSEYFRWRLTGGHKYTSINQVRAEAAKKLGRAIEPGTADAKMVDEAVEVGIVMAARDIIASGRQKQLSPVQIFDELVSLYQRQPNLAVRTSTSVANQAYSTPAPLAYVASELAGITPQSKVGEPTAGNGMLVIGADPKNVQANEINQERADALREQGFTVTQNDASRNPLKGPFDALTMNPPFGAMPDGRKIMIPNGGSTDQIDLAIAWGALHSLANNGKAAIILGGPSEQRQKSKLGGGVASFYKQKNRTGFYFQLYNQYNVVGHYTLAGDLYSKQGASYPVDLIIVHGRRKTPLAGGTGSTPTQRNYPQLDPPKVISSYNELRSLLDGKPIQTTSPVGTGSTDAAGGGTAGESQEAGPGNVPGAAGGQGNDAGTGGDGAGTGQGAAEAGGGTGPMGGGMGGAGPGQSVQGTEPAGPGPAAGGQQSGAGGTGTGGDRVPGGKPPTGPRAEPGGQQSGGMGAGTGTQPPRLNPKVGNLDAEKQKKLQDLAKKLREKLAKGQEKPRGDGGVSAAPAVDPEIITLGAEIGQQLTEAGVYEFGEFAETLGQLAGPAVAPYVKQMYAWNFMGADPQTQQRMTPLETVNRYTQEQVDAFIGSQDTAPPAPPEPPSPPPAPKDKDKDTEADQDTTEDDTEETEKETEPKKLEGDTDKEGNAFQLYYKPKSKLPGMGTLIPKNQADAVYKALEAIEKEHGDIDAWVRRELGYDDDAQWEDAFKAEQVDAIAMALHNLQKRAGFIIGDQTGIGKGRVVAAIMRYAGRQGLIPTFITEKTNLYADIFRDLTDIGENDPNDRFNAIVSNLDMTGGKAIPLPDGRKLKSFPNHAAVFTEAIEGVVQTGQLTTSRGTFDAIFTTYNQLQTKKGEPNYRTTGMHRIRGNEMFILDESHNAGGGETPPAPKPGQPLPIPRSEIIRNMLNGSAGVVYSSATFAKRPQVMDLYFTTDIKLAAPDKATLVDACQRGGVPLQQVISAQLAQAGQYVRRERDFDGVEFKPLRVSADLGLANKISTGLHDIFQFDLFTESLVAGMQSIGGTSAGGGRGSSGASKSNFASVLHNLVDQILLAMKTNNVIQETRAALERGEKPVIALANTMGSFVEDMAREFGATPGQTLDISFKEVLLRYLERARTYRQRNPDGTVTIIRLTDDQLGPVGLKLYNDAKASIEKSGADGLPASPIDKMLAELGKAQYSKDGKARTIKAGEITGRSQTLQYRDGRKPILVIRTEKNAADRLRSINGFNDGSIDVLILNQSGATGLSLHASSKFADQRKRHMIIAQPERNIDTFMQMLGRIHRTGQVVPPRFSLMLTDMPIELRPAAVLMRKLASLNANTTAGREAAIDFESPDFINEVGDKVVADLMADRPDLHKELGDPLEPSGTSYVVEGAAKKVTGRVALLSIPRQQELYEEIVRSYADRLAQLDAMGANPLVAKTNDLQAKTLDSFKIFDGDPDNPSPFAAPTSIEQISMKRIGKPYTSEQVVEKIRQTFEPDYPGQTLERSELAAAARRKAEELVNLLETRTETYKQQVRAEMEKEGKSQDAIQRRLNAIDDQMLTVRPFLNHFMVGTPVSIVASGSGDVFYGVITNIKRTGKAPNPATASSWKVTAAVADAAREITFNIRQTDVANGNAEIAVDDLDPTELQDLVGTDDIMEAFDKSQRATRETRYMVTGNLLAGYVRGIPDGMVMHYTNADGQINQGVLLPKNFDPGRWAKELPVEFERFDHAEQFLRDSRSQRELATRDQRFAMTLGPGGRFIFEAPKSKSAGAQWTQNQDILDVARPDGNTDGFVSVGDGMRISVSRASAERIWNILRDMGTPLFAHEDKDQAGQITGTRRLPPSGGGRGGAGGGGGGVSSSPVAHPSNQPWWLPAARKMAGGTTDVEVTAGEMIKLMEKIGGAPIHYGHGFFGQRKALGWFRKSNHLIRQRTANDLTTAIHEMGHALHAKVLNFELRFPAGVAAELVDMGKQLYGSRKPAGGYQREGLAEYVARYMMGDDMTALAPKTHTWFVHTVLKADKELAADWRRLKGMFEAWEGQGAIARVSAQIDRMSGRGLIGRLKDGWEKASFMFSRYAWMTDAAPLEKAQARLLAEGGIKPEDLPITMKPAELRAAMKMSAPGTARYYLFSAAVDTNYRKVGPSLKEVLSPVVGRLKEFLAYAYARRARVLLDRGINPGISYADATATIKALEGPEFRAAVDGLTGWSNHLIDYLIASGGMSQEAADVMRQMNPVYIPLKRYFDESHLGGPPGAGSKGIANQSSPVKKIKGSGREIIDPIESLIQQAEQIISVANKMQIARSIVDLAERIPKAGWFANKVQAPMQMTGFSIQEIAKQLEAAGADLSSANLDEIIRVFDQAYRYMGKDNIVVIHREGKREFWELDPDVYRVAQDMDKDYLPGFLQFLAAPARISRLGATGLNVAFGGRNLFRDAWTRTVFGTRTRTPLASFAGLWAVLRQDEGAALFEAAGGPMATMMGQDRQTTARIQDEMLSRGRIRRTVRHPIDGLRAVLETIEKAPRVVEFKDALAKAEKKWGKGSRAATLEALLAAKDVTTNFTRAGVVAQALNSLYPFFNARIQSASKFYRAFTAHPLKATGKASLAATAAAFTYITVPSLLLWWMNRDEEWYQELPDYEKFNNWHFSLDEGKTIWKLPIPFELGKVFGVMPVAAIDAWWKKDASEVDEAMFDTLKGFLPVGSTMDMAPAYIKPAAEVVSNHDSFRKQYIVSPFQERQKLPQDQYQKWTTETAKTMGRWLGVSPAKVEHLLSGYTGGLGLDSVRLIETIAGARDVRARELPFVSSFTARDPIGAGRSVEELYDLQKELQQKKGSKKASIKENVQLKRINEAVDRIGEIRKAIEAGKTPEEAGRQRINDMARKAMGKSPIKGPVEVGGAAEAGQ